MLADIGKNKEQTRVQSDEDLADICYGQDVNCLVKGDLEEAVISYDLAINYYPAHGEAYEEAYRQKGAALAALGKYEEALSACD